MWNWPYGTSWDEKTIKWAVPRKGGPKRAPQYPTGLVAISRTFPKPYNRNSLPKINKNAISPHS